MRTYSELATLDSYEDRFAYLRLNGSVAIETFGHERWLNQKFYRSREWQRTRTQVIARDLGCDLGVQGYEIVKMIQVHHMNPMRPKDIHHFDPDILNPEYLISVSHDTHNAIHYGDQTAPRQPAVIERYPGDTTLW